MKLSVPMIPLFLCCATGQAAERPVISLSAGYIYLNVDQHDAARASLHGWYVIPQYHLSDHWSLIAEFTNFYGAPQGQSTNIHGYTAGPMYNVKIGSRVFPFVFGEIGAARVSSAGDVTNNFAFVAGVGANIKLARRFYFQFIPGDYILTSGPGGALHNYAAQAGFVVDLWSKR